MLAKLCYLWSYDDLAVPLIGVSFEVLSVVFFGRVKGLERYELRNERSLPNLLLRDILHHFFRNLFLLIVMIEDDGPILRPNVVPLPV